MRATACILAAVGSVIAAPTYRLDASWKPDWGTSVERMTAAAVVGSDVYAVERGGTDPYSSVVFVLDASTGKRSRQFGRGVIDSAHGARHAVTSDGQQRLFVTDPGDFTIKIFDPSNGHLLHTYGQPHKEGTGLDPIQFGAVADVAVAPGNSSVFYVVDGDGGPNNRLLAMDWATGRVLWHRGSAPSSARGSFDVPHSVAHDDARAALWVADRSNNRTQVFSTADGSFLFEWACFQPGSQPWSIRIDQKRGAVLVADGTLGKLYVFDYPRPDATGAAPACKPAQVLELPPAAAKLHEMAVDPATGAVFIAQVGSPTGLLRVVPQ